MLEVLIISLLVLFIVSCATVALGWVGVLGFLAYKLIKELFNS